VIQELPTNINLLLWLRIKAHGFYNPAYLKSKLFTIINKRTDKLQRTTRIDKTDISNLINGFDGNESLMLTISEPHIRLGRLAIEGRNLEPIINEIIRLVNRYVFGKYKKYESLNGIVIEENTTVRLSKTKIKLLS
jgi:hypothetical protein